MADALSKYSTRQTPQREQAREDQVRNSAGGYVFKAGDDTRIRRFLTLGTEGGTYYAKEQPLTAASAKLVVAEAKRDGQHLIDEIREIHTAGRAPRYNPALFALAAVSGVGDDRARAQALSEVPELCRTGSQLIAFTGYATQFRGWGRGLKRAVADWYLSRDAQELAYQFLKYKTRGGLSQRDLLRLGKPKGAAGQQLQVFKLIAGKLDKDEGTSLPLLVDYRAAHATRKVSEWVRIIERNRSITWEMLPSEAQREPAVWEALIGQRMPIGALIRELGVISSTGLFEGGMISDAVRMACNTLTNPEALRKARIHPVNLLVALRTYASGHAARGKSTWPVSQAICDALDAAFYASFGTIEPSGVRVHLAVDISGSMDSPVSGLPLTCREAAGAMALATAASEPRHVITGFTDGKYQSRWGSRLGSGLSELPVSPRQRLDDVMRTMSRMDMGGTNCAVPMLEATRTGLAVDVFQIYTDNETWSGDIHPHQALEAYRQKTGINARLAVAAFTPTEFTIADPLDPRTLDVSGFDSKAPQLMADFARGDV